MHTSSETLLNIISYLIPVVIGTLKINSNISKTTVNTEHRCLGACSMAKQVCNTQSSIIVYLISASPLALLFSIKQAVDIVENVDPRLLYLRRLSPDGEASLVCEAGIVVLEVKLGRLPSNKLWFQEGLCKCRGL